ncbi:MAG: hypothetical protein HFH62_05675 [Lachnospiraceae bacterium]|nr:hypothetical protein [Lachnospiraceae bacterium]
MEIVNNDWFISISAGLLTGIIVYIITKLLFERKTKKQYLMKIQNANKCVIDSLRSYVVDVEMPSVKIIESIQFAVALEQGIESEQLYDIMTLCKILIQEVISNVYVSNESKKKYLLDLEDYIKEMEKAKKSEEEMNTDNKINKDNIAVTISGIDFLRKMSAYMSLMAGVFSSLGVTFGILDMNFREIKNYLFKMDWSFAMISFLVAASIMIAIVSLIRKHDD